MSRGCFYVRCADAAQSGVASRAIPYRLPSSFTQISVALIATFFLVGLGYGSIPMLSSDATKMISEYGPAAILAGGMWLVLFSVVSNHAKSKMVLFFCSIWISAAAAFIFILTCIVAMFRNADPWVQF